MFEIIGAVLKILQMLLGKWFEFTDEKKIETKQILKEIPDAKTPAEITHILDRIHRL